MAFCVNCGSKLLDGAAFCTECGSPIEKTEAVAVTPTVSAAQPQVEAPIPSVAPAPETVAATVTERAADTDLQAHVTEATKAFAPAPSASDAPTSELPAAVEQPTVAAEAAPVEPIHAVGAEPTLAVAVEPAAAVAEPVYAPVPQAVPAQADTVVVDPTVSAPPVQLSTTTAEPVTPAKSGGGLKIILIVFAGIAVIVVAIVGAGVYFGYDKFQEAKQSFGMNKGAGSSEGKTAADPCALATKEEVSEAFGSTITSAVPHGNKCTYLIANSGNRGITAAVFSGAASSKFRLAVSGAKAQPLDLATGQFSPSGQQAAYAFGTLYFYQNDTFVTLYMSGAYAGIDASQKAAAIARKMATHM
jgi:zinc ribbon protein